jgi:predicted AAA+ superfamily ATPase
MQGLLLKSQKKIDNVTTKFIRYLYKDINLKNKLSAILGARGVGKTTLLLQLANSIRRNKQILYVALDDLFFTSSTLYSLAEDFSKLGGEFLFLDEVHKYPNWSRELKLIYDDFDNLQVIFTSSSVLDIYKGESDLSRRAVKYNLKEMSFREYLILYENIELPTLELSEIITNHSQISLQLTKNFKPLKYYQDYIKVGAYPYYKDDIDQYYQQILNTINLILEIDLQSIENIDYNNIIKIKRLLYILATNVPFTPNISKLSEKIELHRNNLVLALQWLQKAELINTLIKTNKSISSLSKPDKIWLHNTTLNYVLSSKNINIGNIRETFFLQHTSVLHRINLPPKADFLIDNKYTFEVGGKNKTQKQIKNIENAFIVKDDIETGVMNIIPLWLFGLMY